MGYGRIVLAFVGLAISSSRSVTAIWVWLLSAALDLFDGIVARALNQTSTLGIFLDIIADNILRTCVWIAASSSSGGGSTEIKIAACFFISIEWITMICAQLHAASKETHWKSRQTTEDPWIVRICFHNNFRNPVGLLVIYGLFSANMWTYGAQHPVLYDNIPWFDVWRYLAYAGRTLALCVELLVCKSYIAFVIERDIEQRNQDANKQT